MKQKDVDWITKNWDNIDDKYKEDIRPHRYNKIDNLKFEEHIVVLILDRQKPSIETCYNFDQERIGVTRTGKVIWGFDSGCSCPTPWDDNFPDCYNVEKTWKQFQIKAKTIEAGKSFYDYQEDEAVFDTNWDKEIDEKLKEIKTD
jgi:hypothetical protein